MQDGRFWKKVDQRGTGGCWLWTGARSGNGYGAVKRDGRMQPAHRRAFELVHGPIPDGVWVLHECDTPLCCNPAHLHLGDRSRNMKEAAARGRIYTGSRFGQNGRRWMTPERAAKKQRNTKGRFVS